MKFSIEIVKKELLIFGNQKRIAEKLGYSRTYISMVLGGRNPITMELIQKVSEITGKPIDYFTENQSNINSDFFILKEKLAEVETENKTLRQQVDELKNKLIAAMSKQLGIF